MVLYNLSWINRTRQLSFYTLQNLIRKGFAILVGLRCGLFSIIVQLLAAIAAQIRQSAQDIRELAVSPPVTVFNGNSASSGSYAYYLVTVVALGAMGYCYIRGYCYMWWKRLSDSSVMFVTKHDMEKAVATVSNQFEQVVESVSAIDRESTQKLENLNRKVEQQKETSTRIANDINGVNLNFSQISSGGQSIHQNLSGMAGKLDLYEEKQDMINMGLAYLCHNASRFQDASDIVNHSESEITNLDTKAQGTASHC